MRQRGRQQRLLLVEPRALALRLLMLVLLMVAVLWVTLVVGMVGMVAVRRRWRQLVLLQALFHVLQDFAKLLLLHGCRLVRTCNGRYMMREL